MFAYGMEKKGWLYNAFWTNSSVRLPFEEQDGNVQGMYMPAATLGVRFNVMQEGMETLREVWLVSGACTCVLALMIPLLQVKYVLLAILGIAIPVGTFFMLIILSAAVHLTKAGRTFLALRAQARRSTARTPKLTGEEVLLLAVCCCGIMEYRSNVAFSRVIRAPASCFRQRPVPLGAKRRAGHWLPCRPSPQGQCCRWRGWSKSFVFQSVMHTHIVHISGNTHKIVALLIQQRW